MIRVATTLLSPEEMGKVSLIQTTTGFFAFFLVSPVGMFINRRIHAWQEGGRAQFYLSLYLSYLFFVALLAAAGLATLHLVGAVEFGMPLDWEIGLICGAIIVSTTNLTAIPSLNLLGYTSTFVVLSIATVAGSFVWAALLVWVMQRSAQWWLLGVLVGQLLLAVVGVRVLFRRLRRTAGKQSAKHIQRRSLLILFSFSWPVSVAAGLGWVQGQGYRYLMKEQLGLSQLGLFVVGYGISAGVIAGFESVISAYFQPRFYQEANSAYPVIQRKAWGLYATAVIPPLLLTVAFVIIMAPELTRLFLGTKFQSAAVYVVWGALAEAARVLVGAYSLIAHVHMRTSWLIMPNLIGAAISIGLCVLLIPKFGSLGAGLSLALSGLAVVLTMHVLLVRRVDGWSPIRPLVSAGAFAVALWAVAFSLRYLFGAADRWFTFRILAPVCLAYLLMQYLYLRQYLTAPGALTKPI
jgi:O-antigen/teichoic acid export membrane protein